MRAFYGVGLAAALAATSAGAQDMAPPEAPFTGVYIGGAAGFDIQQNDAGSGIEFDRDLDGRFTDAVVTSTGANAFSPGFCGGFGRSARPNTGCRKDRDDAAYYGRVGYDRQFGPFVIGIVGEFGKTEIRDSVTAFSTTPASYTMTRTVDWEAGARLRGGYAVNTTLFYATGGVGYAKIDRSFYTTNTANAFDGRGRREQWGYQAGSGLEQKVTRNISIGLEYLYHQYDDDRYRVRATAGTAPASNPFVLAPNTAGTDFRRSDEKFRWHSIRGTAAFRF